MTHTDTQVFLQDELMRHSPPGGSASAFRHFVLSKNTQAVFEVDASVDAGPAVRSSYGPLGDVSTGPPEAGRTVQMWRRLLRHV